MKHLFTTFAAVMLCLGVSAQDGKKGTNEFSFNVGYDFGLKKGQGGMVTFQPEYGRNFTDQFYLGAGTGLAADDKFDAFAIPVFLRAEVDFTTTKIRPYLSLQGGYDISVSGGDGCVRLNPVVGVKAPLSKTVDFNIGFGYTRTIVNGRGGDFLGFKAGVNFNSQGRGFGDFLKKLDYNVELETYTPASVKDGDYKQTLTGCFGLNLAAIAPMPLENLYAGVSVGFGRYTDKYKSQTYEDKTSEVYLNAGVRSRYKVKQLMLADKIYPFAQLDMGLGGFYEPSFTVNPAIGVSFMTGDKESVDVTLGYTTMSLEDEMGDTKKKGSLRIAVGYTF